MLIGVLALQGDYAAHARAINLLAVETQLITQSQQLEHIDGLVIPGGESTSLLKLMQPLAFDQALTHFYHRRQPIFGTCAGLILLATTVEPQQHSLSLMDITVKRNAYGSQVNSFIAEVVTTLKAEAIEMVFIRAPQIMAVGKDVEVLAQYQQQAVLVRQQHCLAATFHPELTSDQTIHRYFVDMVRTAMDS